MVLALALMRTPLHTADVQERYYAHPAVHDAYGVIAPWYRGLNGQCDLRVRIAAETMKRYPWTDTSRSVKAVPEYAFNGQWNISPEGEITVLPINKWQNGDLVQRASNVIFALVEYYRYSGDPAAIAHITYHADLLVNHCLTPVDHSWPKFPITVPIDGELYGQCSPNGRIQLDIAGEAGLALLQAYQVGRNKTWLDMAKHWANLFAEKRNHTPGVSPWTRFADLQNVVRTAKKKIEAAQLPQHNIQTGGVAPVLLFLDEMIRLGYRGKDDEVAKARDEGRAFMRDVLLPAWYVNDTWGRNYWDILGDLQQQNITEYNMCYMMDNKQHFPNWQTDVRNITSLFLNHTGTNPKSRGDVYSGAWAHPESMVCCGRSLWYGPMRMALIFARYGVEADSEWAREISRRMQILATYDVHETGVSEDLIDGGAAVSAKWFKIAHPVAMRNVLRTISWLPETLGASRENHIVRSSAIVNSVVYGKGRVEYSTFDAPANTIDVLRLAFTPSGVTANGKSLALRSDLKTNGYTIKPLSNGDCIVSIRHDGARKVVVAGPDPAQMEDDPALASVGDWESIKARTAFGGSIRKASAKDASVSLKFRGNQVRLIGSVGASGGKAAVYLDGERQLVGIDCWNPKPRHQQVLYYRNGLTNDEHELTVIVLGEKNPYSTGTDVWVDAVQFSEASGSTGFGEGGGEDKAQRWVFGYTKREDYVDSAGHAWRPATEFVVRTTPASDSVVRSWWTKPRAESIADTSDPELYKFGAHAPEIIVNCTVAPGKYYVRLKLAATGDPATNGHPVSIAINGRQVVTDMDLVATAGGANRATDLVFNDIEPGNGIVEVRLTSASGDAFIQAMEVGPGAGGKGAEPISVRASE